MTLLNVKAPVLNQVGKWISTIGLVSALLAHSACTKKRDARFPEGAGLDLLAISDYDSRVDQLQTTESKNNIFYASSEYSTEKDSSKIKLVNYETDAPFFPKDIEFAGVEKTKYKLIYKVTHQKLIIFRNGPADSVAQEERMLAEKEDDKSLSVPLVSYPITGFYKILVAKDDNGDKTSRLREESVQTKQEATHFRISRVPEVVAFQDKTEHIIRSDYFDGVWYTSSIISKAAEESNSLLGYQASYDSEWKSADKVQFVRTQDYILGLNSDYDKRIKIIDDIDKLNNLTTVIRFPVKYLDSALNSKLDSVKYGSDKAKLKNWKEREWALIDFRKTNSELISSLQKSADPILTNFKMAEDFFIFSLQLNGVKLTISFRRESSIKNLSAVEYTPRIYFFNDFRHFGYFSTNKTSLQTLEKYRLENYELNKFINRFHPEDYTTKDGNKRRRIRFLLTEDSTTEERLVETVRKSLKAWDFAFKQAGMNDVDVYLDESVRVTLGDIRYNSINLVRTLTPTALFGYGPSIADPDTGQIVSATANVHVTSIRDAIVGSLRNYLRHARGDLVTNYPLGHKSINVALDALNIVATDSTATSGGDAGVAIDIIRKKTSKTENLYGHSRCDFALNGGNLLSDIDNTPDCADLREYAKTPKSKEKVICNENSKDVQCQELDVLKKCAEALLPAKVTATILHELGHNFGLQHNFAASADSMNHTHKFDEQTLGTIKDYSCPKTQSQSSTILARSSSVMEYTDSTEDRLTFVGPYDVEAIRYGYVGKIKDIDCRTQPLNINKSIDDNVANLKFEKLPMAFCTDVHVDLKMDPLCQRHDSGKNPLEVVRILKDKYNTLFATENFKYDRAKSPSPSDLANYKAEIIFNRMKMIYEQWRIYLTEFVGEKNASLEIYDALSFRTEVLDKMKSSPRYKQHYEDYYEATREISKFLLSVTFIPDRYCLIKTSAGHYELAELDLLIKQVEAKLGIREISCDSPNIAAELNNLGKFERQVGFYYENQKATGDMHSMTIDLLNTRAVKSTINDVSTGKDDFQSYWDIIGTRLDKKLAKDVLTQRAAVSFISKQRGLMLSMLDEPEFREEFVEKIVNRILYGISYQDIFPETAGQSELKNYYFEKWRTEYDHLIQTWQFMISAFADGTGNKELTKAERNKRWFIANIAEKEKAEKYPEMQRYETRNGSYYVATDAKENKVTIAMLKRLKELLKMQKENPAKFRLKQQDYEAQISLFLFVLNMQL
ncbi:MAG: zinc-dependent metalloprotease [Bdellovibrionaceae bacterium]|nr:zinc-dependent metalloprotease [Pseudobdellovibrionaceae bacterium]